MPATINLSQVLKLRYLTFNNIKQKKKQILTFEKVEPGDLWLLINCLRIS